MYAFFINRPVFASVVALLIVMAGALSVGSLPIEWYPDLAAPQVQVSAFYNGADAETVERTVTARLEEAINGVEGMRYIESTSTSEGVSSITITFDRERDLDIAAVDVQNRVSSVLGGMPAEVRAVGVTVNKTSNSMILGMGVYAENGEYDAIFISNYIDRYLKQELQRIEGVGTIRIFGERKYAMRLWVDPLALTANGLVPGDVVRAVQEQNRQVAIGQIGRSPAPDGQTLQLALTANGRLEDVEDFEDIVVRSDADGGLVRFSDIGRVELGAESYGSGLRFNGHDAAGMGIYQLPSANALEVEAAVRQRLEELAVSFPPGLTYRIAFDTTTIVRDSIDEVLHTMIEAIIIVLLVIFVFLQKWRTTLIPALTIPISLIGTMAFVKMFGFSINTLTLFGLTLATGLVVDDAIVVIENIERHARERALRRKAAALSGTKEVFSAIIAMSLVLISVFVPVIFFPGTTGILYQQFALTIAFSIFLSAIMSLTLAPALAGLMLDPGEPKKTGLFGPFNRGFDWLSRQYRRAVSGVVRHAALTTVVFAALCVLTGFVFSLVPAGFVPAEDQGSIITVVQAPPGTALEETGRIMRRVEDTLRAEPTVENVFAVRGFSFEGAGPNRGMVFIRLKALEDRPGAENEVSAVIGRLRASLGAIPDAVIVPFAPPPIRGVGSLGGFELRLQDRGNLGLTALEQSAQQMMGAAAQRDDVAGVYSSFSAGDPQLDVVLDRERSRALGVPIDQAFNALQVLLGSAYVNDFDFLNRSYRVYVQADAQYRSSPDDVEAIYVRSDSGRPVSLSGLLQIEESSSPQIISHFNLFRSATVNGGPAKGASSGEAIAAMEGLAAQLPAGVGSEWSGLALEETESASQAGFLFLLGLLLTFLVLAAQYESFVLPVVILTAVPMAILGALGLQHLRGLENDVFCQVGLLMLIGLASKNAILIVEFAEQLREEKHLSPMEAVVEACQVRLRPIFMTSFAFILGLLPLVFAEGAGKLARHSLGTAVFGGMMLSTVVNLFFVPVFYVIVVRMAGALRRRLVGDDQHELELTESVPAPR